MAFWNKIFARSRDEPRNIPTGRQTMIGNGYTTTLSPYTSRTANILETLRSIRDEASAIEFLKKVNPDVSMAVWNFVRLANQGNEMKFYGVNTRNKGVALIDVEEQWREFAARINEISNSGLDGLIDQLHYSSFLLGAMGVEVEVTEDRTDIYDVYPVKPQTIYWELGDIDGRKKWIPYQWQMGKKVPLDRQHANFFWVPADPDIGDPRGTLTLTPVLQAIDFQMQILQDLQAVLHHQGWPKDDYEINLERMMQYCPPHIKNDKVKLNEWLKEQYDNIVNMLQKIKPDSDIVHYDDVKRNQGQNNNPGRSLDVRAVNELVDVQVLNGAKQMGILTNRVGGLGQTESWGSITFKIFTDGILSCQRGSKRLIEEIARLWLRVKGIQAIPVFTHNVVNWENEEQRTTVQLMKQQFWVIAQMMGWVDADTACQEVIGNQNAVSDTPSENIRISLNNDSGNILNNKIKMLEDKQKEINKKVIDLFGR